MLRLTAPERHLLALQLVKSAKEVDRHPLFPKAVDVAHRLMQVVPASPPNESHLVIAGAIMEIVIELHERHTLDRGLQGSPAREVDDGGWMGISVATVSRWRHRDA